MLARATRGKWPLAAPPPRATICATPTQHTKAGLQHDAGNNRRLSALAGTRSSTASRKMYNSPANATCMGARPSHFHFGLGQRRSSGNVGFGGGQPVKRPAQPDNSALAYIWLQRICACSNFHFLSQSCFAAYGMVFRRSECSQPSKIYWHNKQRRNATFHDKWVSRSTATKRHHNPSYGSKLADRMVVVFVYTACCHPIRDTSGDFNYLALPLVGTNPPKTLLLGNCGGGAGFLSVELPDISFLIESCERPMMENAGEYGNRFSRILAKQMVCP